MNNNTINTNTTINVPALTNTLRAMNADMTASVERTFKLAERVVVIAMEKKSLECDDFTFFGGEPERVALARESIDDRLSLATAKARRALIWLNSVVKAESGQGFLNVYIEENIPKVVDVGAALFEQTSVYIRA